MSKISLKHSGGNVVSLNSPTSAPTSADVAFKLPNQDGSASEALITDGSGNLSFASVAGGKILQVIQTVKTDTYSESFASNASSASCGLDLNITPSATTSKIFIMAQANVSNSDAIDTTCGIILFRGGSELTGAIGDAAGSREQLSSQSYTPYTSGQGSGYKVVAIPFHYLDSPNSTSQQTYSIRLRYNTTSSSETVYLNRTKDDDNAYYRDRSVSTITAFEVAA
tara:strand:+ start:345 stop:1019 length:675 start_codon:yes stop_codon:yes gene_type:complete